MSVDQDRKLAERATRRPTEAARDTSVTELTAGSGLVGPTLFDAYRSVRTGS